MKNTFLSALSHELRTPLTAILGYAQSLSERGGNLENVGGILEPDQVAHLLTKLEERAATVPEQ